MYPDELVGLLPQVVRYVQEAVVLGQADHGLVRLLGHGQHDGGSGGTSRRSDGAQMLWSQRRRRRTVAARARRPHGTHGTHGPRGGRRRGQG